MKSQLILSWFANVTCSNRISYYDSQDVKQNTISAYMQLNPMAVKFIAWNRFKSVNFPPLHRTVTVKMRRSPVPGCRSRIKG
jgi:hypothetical protein